MSESTPSAETIFEKALELPTPETRDAYLRGACAENKDLRERVRRLVEAHERAEHLAFLQTATTGGCDSAAEGAASGTGADATAPDHQRAERVGERIGRYKLLQPIGEGGCGIVYMAEQEEPLRRRVALKVIKVGMDTKQVVARFEAERQA